MSIAAMKQALEFFEQGNFVYPAKIADALSAAISEAEKCGQAAWMDKDWITSPQPAIPAGWQPVPVEPTKSMLSAGWGNDHLYADLYKAMLAAAPKPEASL